MAAKNKSSLVAKRWKIHALRDPGSGVRDLPYVGCREAFFYKSLAGNLQKVVVRYRLVSAHPSSCWHCH